jgi:predicted nucleotidyltransferase
MGLAEIEKAARFTSKRVQRIRQILAKKLKGDKFSVIAGGSYARGEASAESDLDFFVVCDSEQVATEVRSEIAKIQQLLGEVVPKPPAVGGAFAQVEAITGMENNIGGQLDANDKITRRILFLLEGEWLYNQKKFDIYRRRVLGRYIGESIIENYVIHDNR